MSQAIVERACAKLRSAIGDEAVARLNFTADLRDMLEALEAIQPVLDEAEVRPLWDTSASDWLCLVRTAAYKTIDTVDELQDARPKAAATMTKMLPRLTIMKNVMAIQVQETRELVMWAQEQLRALSKYLAENTIMFQKIIEERKTGPVFEEAMVLGRGSDKERIIATLLSTEPNIMREHITILPIFGLAGSGKTTLAQMVFNDTHSLQGYDFRVWVHVSPQFDFHTIGKFIICHVSGRGQEEINHSSSGLEGMESIMKRLRELLNLKKVLLVLDDLWEEAPIQLQLLKSMLTFLGSKVDVIVTTCNQSIARKIGTIEPYRLNPLSDDTCWEIIKRNSIHFEKQDKEEELEKIGREMASRCRGVPSAAPAFAGLLDFYRDDWKWEGTMLDICSKLLLPISTIDLSYRSMPPDLKLCFAYYCLIFQEGHNIVKDGLVHHWIALNLIEPSEVLSATQIAEEHITRLLDMSFLQTVKSDHVRAKDDKGGILFTMHNLVHDLARRFAGCSSYCLAINHHGQLDAGYVERQRALRCVGCSKVEFNTDTFSRRKCLRVMELKESAMQKLPDSIWQLSYMGYLKISEFTGLVTLPESFGHLTNLFHVDLSGCSGLQNLPESFEKLTHLVHANLSGCSELLNLPASVGKLVNLVHINLSGCSGLAALPESFGDLVNLLHIDLSHCHRLSKILEVLQKLDKVVYLDLSFWSCFEGIGGLGGLTNLEHLNLSNPCCHLAQRRSPLQELKDAVCKLTKLRYLNLSMCLNPIFYYHQSRQDSLQYIADCIKGLSCLEHLDLSHNTFLFDLPESLGDLNRLHTLDLSGCIRIKKVGETKSLKVIIDLSKCRGLESCQLMIRVDEGAYGSTSNLAQLEVVDCKELEISCLERLQSLEEAQRIRLVDKQKVERLKLCWSVGGAGGSMKVDENALLGELVPPHSLQFLQICGYGGETCLPAWRIPSISSHLRNLIEVTMEDFPRCVVLPPLGLFPNLQRLVLRRMARITRIDAGELSGGNKEAFTRLSKLTIDHMENLKEFKFAAVDELVIQKCPLLSFGCLPPRAERLLISDSDQLMSSSVRGIDGVEGPSFPVTELVVQTCNLALGDWSFLHHLPGLCSLTINNCYNLTSSPEIISALSSLQSLCFYQCHEPMESLPVFLCDLTSLQQLAIDECHGVQSLPEDMLAKLTSLEALYIWDCPELKEWCESEENFILFPLSTFRSMRSDIGVVLLRYISVASCNSDKDD